MTKYTNLVLSGENPDSLIEPIKNSLNKYGSDKLIIVVPEKKESQFTNIKEKYSGIFNDITIREVNTKDMVECASGILDIILEEKQAGKEGVAINISNSLPILAISGYISASLSKSPIIMSLNTVHLEVPLVPYCKPVRVRYEILAEIPDEGIDSQKKLEDNVNKNIRTLNKKIERENAKLPKDKKPAKKLPELSRSNLSQHLNTLESKGYIERKGSIKQEGSDSRTKRIHLTSFGKLIKQSFEVLEIGRPIK